VKFTTTIESGAATFDLGLRLRKREMTMKTLIALVIAGMLASVVAQAIEPSQNPTANATATLRALTLALRCVDDRDCPSHGSDDDQSVFIVLGYVAGLAEGLAAGEAICPPEGANREQHTRLVLRYLQEHPEELHKHSGVLIVKALATAYSCKKK